MINDSAQIPYNPEYETLDAALGGRVKVIQPRKGFRFSVDALLLADFAADAHEAAAVDLGAGSGVVGLLLLQLNKAANVIGLELQDELADMAARNAEANGFSGRYRAICGDLRNIGEYVEPRSAKLVVSNPPFYKQGCGRDNQDSRTSMARRESHCTMRELVRSARYILSGTGRAAFVYPAERLAELCATCADEKLPAKRLRLVHGKPGQRAKLALVEAAPDAKQGLTVEAPLILENEDGSYTPEAKRILYG